MTSGGKTQVHSSDCVIEVQEVFKSFKSLKAVRGVSLNVERVRFVALLGPNGADKSIGRQWPD